MYDLAIIGGGPAGVAAGVYAARKRLSTLFIAETVGGQSTDSNEIQNWIGTEKISGLDLAKSLENHLKAYASDVVDIHLGERATVVTRDGEAFSIQTGKGTYQAKTILVATGGARRKLNIPGSAEFEHKGVTYCASCDGPLFAGQDVAVVGGGNAGFESASQLLAYCKSVTLIHRNAEFDKADASTVETVLKQPNMKTLTSTEPIEVKGDKFVSALVVKNNITGDITELPVAAVFVEIGMISATDFVKDLVVLNPTGKILVDPKTQRAQLIGNKTDGVWAAGDCTDGLYHQNNIAAGDAVKALEDIYYFLRAK